MFNKNSHPEVLVLSTHQQTPLQHGHRLHKFFLQFFLLEVWPLISFLHQEQLCSLLEHQPNKKTLQTNCLFSLDEHTSLLSKV